MAQTELLTAAVAVLLATPVAAQMKFSSTPILQSGGTNAGGPIAYPKTDSAEVTALRVDIGPGGETGRHIHLYPAFVYVLEGAVDVEMEGDMIHSYKAGIRSSRSSTPGTTARTAERRRSNYWWSLQGYAGSQTWCDLNSDRDSHVGYQLSELRWQAGNPGSSVTLPARGLIALSTFFGTGAIIATVTGVALLTRAAFWSDMAPQPASALWPPSDGAMGGRPHVRRCGCVRVHSHGPLGSDALGTPLSAAPPRGQSG